jgi:hypothetical protein
MNPYDELVASESPAPVSSNPYDAIINDEDTQRRAVINQAVAVNPDQAAKAKSLAGSLPEDVALRNLPELERNAAISKIEGVSQRSEVMRSMMRDQGFANIAHDDVDNLTAVASAVRMSGAFGEGIVGQGGLGSALTGASKLKDISGRGIGGALSAIGADSLKTFLEETEIPWWLDPAKVLLERPGLALKDIGKSISPEKKLFREQVASGLGQFGGQAATSILTGGTGAGLLMLSQGVDAMSEKVQDDPTSQANKDITTLVGAGITAATEKYALDKILGPMAVPIKNQIAASLARIGIGAATEGAQEMAESIGQDVARILLTNPDAKIDVAQTLQEGAVGGTVGGIARSVVESVLHIKRRGDQRMMTAAEAGQTAQALQSLDELAKASKVRTRDADTFEKFIEKATEDGPIQDVFLSGEVLMQSGLAEQLAHVSPSIAEQAQLAAATGGDIRIPIAEYATKIAGTDLSGPLIEHLKTSVNGISQAESKQTIAELIDTLKADSDRLLGGANKNADLMAGRDQVLNSVLQKLNAVQRFTPDVNTIYATQVANFFAVQAQRAGMTPQELFAQYEPSIVAEGVGGPSLLQSFGAELEAKINADFAGAQQEYAGLQDAEGGRVLNTDLARELSPAYREDRSRSADVHEPSSAFIKRVYAERLSQPTPEGKDPVVLFTAGGTGAGKSTGLRLQGLQAMSQSAELVYDTNMNKLESAVKKIQQALEAGRQAVIVYTFRDPVEALVNGALPRAMRMGRTVPVSEHYNTHVGAYKTMLQLREKYADNEDVQILVVDNSKGAGKAVLSDLDSVVLQADNELKGKLDEALKSEFEAGRISKQVFQGFAGKQSAAQGLGEEGGSRTDRQPEPASLAQDEVKPKATFSPDTRTIALLKGANLSSFLHESGHFYLEVMADLASKVPAIREDMDAVLKWFGIEGDDSMPALDRWHALPLKPPEGGGPSKEPYHEKFARGFEAWLFEGRAPSVEMKGAFARFRAWMVDTYRSIKALNVELTDEVRSVFDRMLATPDQIEAAQASREMGLMFASEEEARKFGVDWAAYQAKGQQATEEAVAELDKRSLADMQWLSGARSKALRALQRQSKQLRSAVEDEVAAEVDALPVQLARDAISDASQADPATKEAIKEWQERRDGVEESVRQSVKDELLAEEPELSGLQKAHFINKHKAEIDSLTALEMSAWEEGNPKPQVAMSEVDTDAIADQTGFASGEEMLRTMLESPSRTDLIKAMTDQRMLERYGDITSQEAMEAAADDAVHNQMRQRVLVSELEALEKTASATETTGKTITTKTKDGKAVTRPQTVRTLPKAAKEFAQNLISGTKVRDLKPAQYASAAARAGVNALRALKKNDIAEAAKQKRNQLVQGYLTKAANEALEDVDSILAYFKRIDTEGARKSRRGEFLEQRDALLERYDLRKSQSLARIDSKAPLADWIKAESERLSAIEPDLPAWVLDETSRKHYKEMTVEELRGLKDAVEQLDKLAKREQAQYTAIRNQTFEQEKVALLDKLRKTQPQAFDDKGEPLGVQPDFVPSIGKGLEKLGDKFLAEFLNVENLIGVLEGKEQGAVWESLFGRISRQSDWKSERLGKVYKELKPLFDQYSYAEKVAFSRKDIGTQNGIGIPMTRENALVVALLNGNKEGRERLANYGWGQNVVQSIVDMLDAKDIKLAEGIWRMFDESLWPELKSLNDRTKGASPPKVEAIKFKAKGGELIGGYFPLRYNTDLDERAQRYDESQAVKDMLGGSALGMSAKTRQGTSQERQEGVKMRPRLDLQVFSEVVNETVHDIAYREAVADTMRMLNDKEVQNALKVAAGVQSYRAMVTRVRETAAPPRNPSGFIEKTLSIARKNTIVTLMSGVKTALQNFTGLFPAMAKVGPGTLTRELGRFFSPKMVERTRFAMSQSAYLRGRFDHYDRDLQDAASRLTVNGKIMPDTAYFLGLMGLVDRAVTVPVWNAAFAEGMKTHNNDQARAVDYADSIVRTTQGSGREVDLAKIQSGHGGYGQLKRVFTMFYSYFSGQLGLLVQTGAVAKQEAKTDPAAAVAKFTAKFMAIVVIPTVLSDILMNGPDGDDDDQAKRWAKAFGKYGASFFPVVRDFYSFALSKFDPSAKYHNASFRMSPIEAAFEGVGKGIGSGIELVEGGGDIKDVKGVIMGLGFMLGLPGKLISDTMTGTNAWLEGKAGPEAVVFGPPKR